MRPPPPISELPRFPIVGGTVLLSIGATLFYLNGYEGLRALTEGPEILLGEYWRLLTSMLLHGDWFHLLFNIYWIWVFGTLLEKEFGHAVTLGMIVLLAAGSGAAEYAVLRGGIGLSGVAYGFFAMIWVLSRVDRRFEGVIDSGTVIAFVAWFFICIGLTVSDAMPIANIAHGFGTVLGALLGVVIGMPRRRIIAVVGLAVLTVSAVVLAVRFRPLVNLDSHRGEDEHRLGNRLFEAGRFEDALKVYQEGQRLRPNNSDYWHNIAAALFQLGRIDEGNQAMQKERELTP